MRKKNYRKMSNMRIFVGLLMALLFSMCTSPKQKGGGLPVLNVADALDAALPDTFTWNSIAKNVRMIPLKTEHVMGGSPNVKYFSDDLIIVYDLSTRSVFVFDGEGREKVVFSHYGQGPKEYLYVTAINYQEKDSLIMLYDNGKKKLFRFDLQGRFVDARLADTGGIILRIDSEGNMSSINKKGKALVSLWDNNLQLKGEYLPFDTLYDDQQKISTQILSGKTNNCDAFKLLPVYSDTVYSITKEGVEPFCVLDRGGYKCSADDLKDMQKVMFNSDYLCGEQLYSVSSYFCYFTQAIGVMELWDMRSGELVAWNKRDFEGPEHDLVWGFRYVFPSGYEIRPFTFDYISKDRGIFIRQADECLDDVEGLTADDNPVLVVLEF